MFDVVQGQTAKRSFGLQMSKAFFDNGYAQFGIFVARASGLFGLLQCVLKSFDVGKHQFRFNHVDVGQRIDASRHVGDVWIVKAADDLHDRIDFANVA